MLETRRHDADDLHTLAIEPQRAPNDLRVATVSALPETITQDDDQIVARLILFGGKSAPQRRRYAQRRKKSAVTAMPSKRSAASPSSARLGLIPL